MQLKITKNPQCVTSCPQSRRRSFEAIAVTRKAPPPTESAHPGASQAGHSATAGRVFLLPTLDAGRGRHAARELGTRSAVHRPGTRFFWRDGGSLRPKPY